MPSVLFNDEDHVRAGFAKLLRDALVLRARGQARASTRKMTTSDSATVRAWLRHLGQDAGRWTGSKPPVSTTMNRARRRARAVEAVARQPG